MSYSLLALAAMLLAGVAALRASQISRMRRVSLHRIGLQTQDDVNAPFVFVPDDLIIRTYPQRYRFAGPAAALLIAASIHWLTNWHTPYAFAFGILIGVITYLLEMYWADLRVERIEAQLADAIDMMVASLRAGSALLAVLEATAAEARQPLRGELDTLIGRMRLGEDPRAAVRDLAMRVPLESFRLFTHSLLVHWETGGSLASSLRTVGSTVRDRLEVSRRISAQAVEAQISVAAVMIIAYGLTVLMLKANPGPLQKLLSSVFGSYVAAVLIALQALGMFWIWRMSRIRF
jgi:tight adherence protein B